MIPIFAHLRKRASAKPTNNRRLRIEMLESRITPAPFTAGNVVVYRVGDGASGLLNTGSAVFLDEFDPDGTLVQSLAMPTTASGSNKQLIASGTANTEGLLAISADGQYLVATGYASDLGGSAILPASTSSTINRTLGLIKFDGTINTSTALSDASSAGSVRSAVSTNGSDLWVAGVTGGIRYTTVGSTTSTQINSTPADLRQVHIFDGQLYASTVSGTSFRVGTVGTGIPTGSGQTITSLPGVPTGSGTPNGFFFADLDTGVAGADTLYVAYETSAALAKYSLVSGTWVANGAIGVDTDDYRSVTGIVSGTSVTLFATRKGGSTGSGGGELIKVTDTSGYNGTLSGTPTVIRTADSNTAFRGVAISPQPVNQAPVNTLPSTFNAFEDQDLVLAGISVSDADAGAELVKVTLSVPSGDGVLTLTAGITNGVAAGEISGNGTNSIEVTSTISKINATLASSSGLVYSPVAQEFGDVVLTMVTNDLGHSGTGGPKTDTSMATIAIAAVADDPSVTNATTDEDTQTSSGLVISRNSVDGTEVTHFRITNILNGVLYQNDGTTVIDADQFITFAQGNAGLRFTPASNFNGNATFQIQASTSANTAGLGGSIITATVVVSPKADTPSVTSAATDEDTQSTSGLVISRHGDDGTEVTHFKITDIASGTLYQNNGTTQINNGDFITFAQGNAGLTFSPASNFHGTASFKLQASLSSSDAGLGGSQVTAAVAVTPIADTPSVTDASTNEDSQTNSGLVISRNSNDGGDVTHFKISGISNGTLFQNNGTTQINNGDFITFAQGNAGLKFTPSANFVGAGSFTVQASTSNSDAGLGGSTVNATITVNAVADTPSVTSAATDEDTQSTSGLVISRHGDDGTEVTHFKITDITSGTLYQNNGTTQINNGDFITFAQGNAGLKFSPASNFHGTASFKLQASLSSSDAGLGGSQVTAAVAVTPIADTPSVTDASTNEDSQTTSGLVISRNSNDGAEVTHFKITGITNGTLFQNNGTTHINNGDFITFGQGNAGLKFTPSANFVGAGSFTVQASTSNSDAGLGGSTVNATITVNAVADTPSVTSAATDEDTQSTSGLVISRHGDDGTEVTHFKITDITSGTLYQNNGTTQINNGDFITFAQGNAGLKFSPASNFHGTASFKLQASLSSSDAGLGGSQVTAAVAVTPIADTPSVTDASTNEDNQTTSGLVISRNSNDGAEVTHFKITGITNGTLFQNNGTTHINNGDFITFGQGNAGLKFTPSANFVGAGSFTVQASTSNTDAGLGGSTVDATITVDALADTPSVTNAATDEDTQSASGLVLSRHSADGAEVTHFQITNITNGTLYQNDGTTSITNDEFITFDQGNAGLKFTPLGNFNGTATFQIQASLGGSAGLGGDPVTANIVVNGVNDGPTIGRPSFYTTNEDSPVFLTGLSVSDLDAGPEIVRVSLFVDGGLLNLNDSVTGGVIAEQISGNGGNSITVFATVAEINATLSAANGLRWTPTANSTQNATLFFQVNDQGNTGSGGPQSAFDTIGITVNPVNDEPTVTAPSLVDTNEDSPLAFTGANLVSVGDVDFELGTELVQVTLTSTHGVVELTDTTNIAISGNGSTTVIASGFAIDVNAALATLLFTPDVDYFGAAAIDIVADDLGQSGSGGPLTGTERIDIAIASVNDTPVLGDSVFAIAASVPTDTIVGVVSASDIESNTISYAIVAGDPTGVFAIDANGTITVANAAGLTSSFVLTVQATDNGSPNQSDTGTVTIHVDGYPVANGIADRLVDEDDMASFPVVVDLAAAFDDEEDSDAQLSFSIVGNTNPVLFASADLIGNSLLITPTINANGESTLTIRATDTANNSIESAFNLIVNPVNDAPTLDAIGDATIDEDSPTQTIGLTGIGVGPANEAADGQTITSVVAVSSDPNLIADPTIVFEGGVYSLEFTPSADANGSAVITVTVTDSGDGTNSVSQSFTVNVAPTPDAPVIDTDFIPMLPGIFVLPPKADPAGSLVADLLAGVSDVDTSDGKGIAITSVLNVDARGKNRGTWQFKLPGDADWTNLTGVSPTNALLLAADADTRIRFLPNRRVRGFFSVSFHAWDQSNGLVPGTTVDPTTGPSYSAEVERAWVAVGKTKPTVDASGRTVLKAIKEDARRSKTYKVKNLLGIAGLETPENPGMAVVFVGTTDGQWEYKLHNSKAWLPIENVSETSALLIGTKDKLRFRPNTDADGEGILRFKTWNLTGGAPGDLFDSTMVGAGVFGVDSGTAIIDIIAVNDSPSLTQNLSSMGSVDAGATTSEISLADVVSGTDAEGISVGVAIVGFSGRGVWEYSTTPGVWVAIDKASGSRPLLLDLNAQIRFSANPDARSGSKARLTLKTWDRTDGTVGNVERAGLLSKTKAKLDVAVS